MLSKPYYMQWNVDVHGTPISIHREEKHQVSSVYFDIKLEEIPDEYQRLIVKDSSGVMLHEVVDFDKLSSASYFVDYNNGVVYFHQDNGGMVFDISYYGRGFRRIPANRIILEDGSNIEENIQKLGIATTNSRSNGDEFLENIIKGLSTTVERQGKQIKLLLDAIEDLQKKVGDNK